MGNQKAPSSQESLSPKDKTAELTQVIEALHVEIAERKRAETRFRNLLEATPDAMIVVDDQGKIALANAQAERLFGYSQEALAGQVVELLIPGDLQDKHRQHRAGYFANPQTRPMGMGLELYARRQDGVNIPVEISLSPLQTEEGLFVLSAIRDITLRKRVQQALSESEERFRVALKSSPLVVSHQDRELRFTWIYNPPPGFSAEAVLGKTDADLLPPQDAKWLTEIKRRVIESGVGVQQEFEITLGTAVYLYDLTIEPLRDADGQIVGITSAAIDITDHKRAEERFRKLLEATPDAMIIVDEVGKIVLANAQTETLFGYPPKTLVGQSVERLIPARFHERHKEHRAGYSAQPQVRPMGMGLDLYAIRQDGTEFPAEISLSPLQTEEGVLILAAVRDVTDRKQAEMALQHAYGELASQVKVQAAELSQAQKDLQAQASTGKSVGQELAHFTNQLRAVADVSQQLNTVLDSDKLLYRVVTLLQERFDLYYVHVFLLDPEKNMLVVRAGSGETGNRLRQQQYRVPRDAGQSPVAQAARSRGIVSLPDVTKEPRFLPNPLLPQTRSEIAIPLLARDELLGVIDVQDNQPHRFSQSDIYIFSTLAGHIATALQNARLFEESRRAQDALREHTQALERSNQELEQFAYVASHDLQEPLRMVTSYMQLLARRYQGRLGADADEFIAFAVDGANRMKDLINDLLAYSRIGTRGQTFQPVDCESALVQALQDLQLAIKENQAEITWDPLPGLTADKGQLTLVFRNLIGNAVKFRSQQQPEIHVSARRHNGEWLFSVGDNGIGIGPEYAERIFILFQRLHTRDEYPGTGIGLAICKKVVERHGGRIWVESTPGRGSVFYFTLPEESVPRGSS